MVHLAALKGSCRTEVHHAAQDSLYTEIFVELPEKRGVVNKLSHQFRYYWALFNIVKQLVKSGNKPDCIHAQVTWKCGFDAALLSKWFGIPFLVTEHNTDWLPEDRKYPLWKRLLSRWALKKANAVTAVSQNLANAIEKETKKKVEVIPNSIHPAFLPEKVGSAPQIPVFLHISNFRNAHKQTDRIVKVFSLFAEENAEAMLQLNVPEKEFRSFKEQNPHYAWDRIELLPPAADRQTLAERMSKATAIVSYSRFETFGLTLAEAACLGVPSIYTACGGADVFFDAEMGEMCDADNYQSLLKALCNAALPGRFNRQLIAEKGRRLFSNDAVLEAYDKLYRNITN